LRFAHLCALLWLLLWLWHSGTVAYFYFLFAYCLVPMACELQGARRAASPGLVCILAGCTYMHSVLLLHPQHLAPSPGGCLSRVSRWLFVTTAFATGQRERAGAADGSRERPIYPILFIFSTCGATRNFRNEVGSPTRRHPMHRPVLSSGEASGWFLAKDSRFTHLARRKA
jgi:hypothetical protein